MIKKIKFDEVKADVELQPLIVTAENYAESCTAFFVGNGKRAFVVARREVEAKQGFEIRETRREFAAWRAWRIARKLPVHVMDRLGYYQVPTRWPEQFDVNWSAGQSQMAADRAHDAGVFERQARETTPTERRKVIAAAYARARQPTEYPPANFPFGAKPNSIDRPTHPPVYGTVFYDEGGTIIAPPVEKHPKHSTFKRLA